MDKYPFWLTHLLDLLHTKGSTDIFLNGYSSTYLLKPSGSYESVPGPFTSEAQMEDLIQEFVWSKGQRLDHTLPWAGGDLEQAYRWHSMISPASAHGTIFTLRFHRGMTQDFFQPFAERQNGLLSEIDELVKTRKNILICGETGSGKTSLLYHLLQKHCQNERVILIEDVKEIPMGSPLWLKLTTKAKNPEGQGEISLDDLFRESLRLRGDRLVCGEIRALGSDKSLESLYSGQGGFMSTFHGQDKESVKKRLKDGSGSGFLPSQKDLLWGIFLKRGQPSTIWELSQIFDEKAL